jgi:cephalosporin-C deacetylase-like acetyl esterase
MEYFGRLTIALAALAVLSAGQLALAVDCSSLRKNLPPYPELAKAFAYDAGAPLDLRVLSTSDVDGVAVQSIEFAIGNAQPCSAMLAVPKQRGPLPAVVWLGSGDKDWTPYATNFAKLGAVSLTLDNCGNAPASDASGFYRDEVQAVIEVRRAVDLLIARPDIDRKRIAFVGHSGGAMLGADAVAVDRRFRAAVFESGLQGFTYHICTSPHPYAVGVRQQLGNALPQFIRTLAPLDAILYVGHEAPTALLFQSAALDKSVPRSDAQAFFDAASEPKRLIWYKTGHEMKLPAVDRDRTAFLREQLEMK